MPDDNDEIQNKLKLFRLLRSIEDNTGLMTGFGVDAAAMWRALWDVFQEHWWVNEYRSWIRSQTSPERC